MVKNRTIQIRITKDEYVRIGTLSRLKGFTSLSSYLRFVALDQEPIVHQKISESHARLSEIHAHLLGPQPIRRFKANPLAQ